MKILELFCGTKSISKAFKERGHQTFTVDFDKQFNPDLSRDILDFEVSELPEIWRNPDVIWASPPCTTFSVAGRNSNYTNFMPNNVKACFGLAYIHQTLKIIEELRGVC